MTFAVAGATRSRAPRGPAGRAESSPAVPQRRVDRTRRERRKRQRRDEALGTRRHDHVHDRAVAAPAHSRAARFVRGDAAADAEQNARTVHAAARCCRADAFGRSARHRRRTRRRAGRPAARTCRHPRRRDSRASPVRVEQAAPAARMAVFFPVAACERGVQFAQQRVAAWEQPLAARPRGRRCGSKSRGRRLRARSGRSQRGRRGRDRAPYAGAPPSAGRPSGRGTARPAPRRSRV